MEQTADLGGRSGFGRVPVPDPDEAPFPERWEGRAFALTALTMGRISGRNLDAFRYALSRLSEQDYFDDGYYGRWLHAAELMLVESRILAPGAVDARARGAVEPAVPEPDRPDYAPSAPGSLRSVPSGPRFGDGQEVRTLDRAPAGPSKLPGYLRSRQGVITAVRPPHVLPDTHAVFEGENPEHVYTVGFSSTELWGSDAEEFTVHADLFESYLEARP